MDFITYVSSFSKVLAFPYLKWILHHTITLRYNLWDKAESFLFCKNTSIYLQSEALLLFKIASDCCCPLLKPQGNDFCVMLSQGTTRRHSQISSWYWIWNSYFSSHFSQLDWTDCKLSDTQCWRTFSLLRQDTSTCPSELQDSHFSGLISSCILSKRDQKKEKQW